MSKSETIHVTFPEKIHDKIVAEQEETGLSKSEIVRQGALQYLRD